MPARGQDFIYPKDFRANKVATNGTRLYVRLGGAGPPVVLIHGYGETGDMWLPLAKELARDHTVVVPDLRGMGLSAIPPSGYDKKTQARDIAGGSGRPQDRPLCARYARHRQHGRLCLRGIVPPARDALRPDRCASAWRRPLG
jgi:pimeloyl-ACP methyl ester carboxylesterase